MWEEGIMILCTSPISWSVGCILVPHSLSMPLYPSDISEQIYSIDNWVSISIRVYSKTESFWKSVFNCRWLTSRAEEMPQGDTDRGGLRGRRAWEKNLIRNLRWKQYMRSFLKKVTGKGITVFLICFGHKVYRPAAKIT